MLNQLYCKGEKGKCFIFCVRPAQSNTPFTFKTLQFSHLNET